MAYVALKHLRWGDEYIAPGDPVPDDDPSRDYESMIRAAEIREEGNLDQMSDEELRAELEAANKQLEEAQGNEALEAVTADRDELIEQVSALTIEVEELKTQLAAAAEEDEQSTPESDEETAADAAESDGETQETEPGESNGDEDGDTPAAIDHKDYNREELNTLALERGIDPVPFGTKAEVAKAINDHDAADTAESDGE